MLALLLSPQFVVAVNNPLMWTSLHDTGPTMALAASGYVGVARNQAVRVNVASYEIDNLPLFVSDLVGSGDGSCAFELSGHSDDIGAGWMYFRDDRWRGPSVELGAVRKSMRLTHCLNDSYGEYLTETHSTATTYAARVTVGWSWLYGDHAFASFGAGASVGRDTEHDDTGGHAHRFVASPELYVRIGVAI
jgi:hypothetical protein